MMTTVETLTTDQLDKLKISALKKGDLKLAALAHVAITGERYKSDSPEWGVLSPGERVLLRDTTEREAKRMCVVAINYGEKD